MVDKKVWRIIGNMTGNSMDAIDLVLTEFKEGQITTVCTFTKKYTANMQSRIGALRNMVHHKTRPEIMAIPEFKSVHDEYIRQIADCINEMCDQNAIDKKTIDAIGFHGKTLDHNPPSVDKENPFTLQIGSGQMLADLTQIPVVYDFRSALLMAGFDGAPLVPVHNAHLALAKGDACYYNGGNTSNFAFIKDGKVLVGSDAGPFNEYTDSFIRTYSDIDTYDKDGKYGIKGDLDTDLLQYLFDKGRDFYELPLPRSGDPQYYHTKEIFADLNYYYDIFDPQVFCNIVHTFEYFAAYIAVHTLTFIDETIDLPCSFELFGGGWKNPLVRKSFENLLLGKESYVLDEHKVSFARLKNLFSKASISYSSRGEYMEAQLFADMARYRLQNQAWEIPEISKSGKHIICGRIALPDTARKSYSDQSNHACCGWQNERSAVHTTK